MISLIRDTCENRQVEVGSGATAAATGNAGQRLAARRLNHHRNGYRMPCKPPGYRQPQRGLQSAVPGLLPALGRRERTRNRAEGAFSGVPGSLAHGLPARSATDGQLRRNAVGALGVKLDAAPDAPPWGKVLACSPQVPVRIQRRAGCHRNSSIPAPPHLPGADGVWRIWVRAVPTCPAIWSSRGCLKSVRMRVVIAQSGGPHVAAGGDTPAGHGAARGWRIAEQLARPIGRVVTAGDHGRICGQRPRPGKDPS